MKVFILITSLLGVYGLVNNNKTGVYFALLTPLFEMIFGGSSLIEALNTSNISVAFAIQALVSTVLGFTTCLCVFKTNPQATLDTMPAANIRQLSDSTHEYAVEVVDVTKKYFLGPIVVPAINGLSLRVHRGEFVALMGPSGSGKSTLLNLIGALDRPSSGRVLIDGVDISTLDDSELARLRNEKIGFVFQAYNLIARSNVLRNMELPALVKGYPKKERLKRINDLLTIVGLDDKAPRKPKTLSGGEQQRVAIARALINDPSIILADEPTGNIDSKTGREIMGFLKKMNVEKGTTVIVVTHAHEVARMADRTIHLRDGRITEEETVGSLAT